MPRVSSSILTCICTAVVGASSSMALAGATDTGFTVREGAAIAIHNGNNAEGNCLSCDAGGICDTQVGITGPFVQFCNDGQWVSVGFPFDTGGAVVSSVTSVHFTNTGIGDMYIMSGTCGGPDTGNILAVICGAIVGAPSGVPITTNFTPVATSAVDPTWVVLVFRDSFAFDVMFNAATNGAVGSAFGNLSGLPGPAEWIDLVNFGFGACYCVTLAGGPGEPGACCLEDFTCVDGLLPDDCAVLGGVFQGNNSNCADVDCGPETGACCLEEGDVCQDGTTESDCEDAGGTWQGADSDCSNINCAFPDDCVDAQHVEVPSTTNGDNIGAQDDDVPSCGTSITPGVWYSMIGTGNTITASTCNAADFDTKLTVFCGDCDDLTCIIGNDDTPGCGGFTTELSWCSQAGAEYLLLVHGFFGDTGNFTLTISDDGVACTPTVECIPPIATGGCCQCDGEDQFCSTETEEDCAALGGEYLGDDAACAAGGEQITYSSSPNLSIPDGNLAGVSDTITVPESFSVVDLEVQVDITHTWVGDLCVTLSKDGGADVVLIQRMGDNTGLVCDNSGCCGCSADNFNVTLDDEAGGSINNECSDNLVGTFRPDPGALAGYVGGDSAGAWTLTVNDNFAADVGTLNNWSLIFTQPGTGASPCEEAFPEQCAPDNAPPDCSGAFASDGDLWPPNHSFHNITIEGVTDPDGDTVSITITAIFQDESVNGQGDGNTCPDGTGVGTSTASVRAERSGLGDGRVYHISFVAEDGNGGECEGTVTVCVPHSQQGGGVCVDQGPLHDSTDCGGGSSSSSSRHGGSRSRSSGR